MFVACAGNIAAVSRQLLHADDHRPGVATESAVHGSIQRAFGASFEIPPDTGCVTARFRDDVDNTPDGIATPQCALRTAYNLNALDIGCREVLPAEFIARRRIVGTNAVDEHEHLVSLGTTHAHLRLGAHHTRVADRKPRNCAQQLRDIAYLAPVDILSRDDGNGTADVPGRYRRA